MIGALLDAVLPDGSGEPNYEARAYGVLALAAIFKVGDEQRAEAYALLQRVRPNLAADPQVARLLRLHEARQALVRAVEEGRLHPDDLPPELVLRA